MVPECKISNQTVCNRLHEYGLNARRPAVGHILTSYHRQCRLEFAEHLQWRMIWDEIYSQTKAGFICHHVMDVFECGDGEWKDMHSVTLYRGIDMGWVNHDVGLEFV